MSSNPLAIGPARVIQALEAAAKRVESGGDANEATDDALEVVGRTVHLECCDRPDIPWRECEFCGVVPEEGDHE